MQLNRQPIKYPQRRASAHLLCHRGLGVLPRLKASHACEEGCDEGHHQHDPDQRIYGAVVPSGANAAGLASWGCPQSMAGRTDVEAGLEEGAHGAGGVLWSGNLWRAQMLWRPGPASGAQQRAAAQIRGPLRAFWCEGLRL